MHTEAIKELLYKMADDQLIIGHRNSEWTGMGPLLEEDIAFSSMAQDKVGQSLAFYSLLHELGESDPDTVAFMRNADQFHNCTFTELPPGEYDFSLVRHFLFDTAEFFRFLMLSDSGYEPIRKVALKLKGEVKYHLMHADSMIHKLGTATDESIGKMQAALDEAMPWALGIFEPSPFEEQLIADGIFAGEQALQEMWLEKISETLQDTALQLPHLSTLSPAYGGRTGQHTEYLQPMLEEMSEVFREDPTAEW